MINDPIQPVHGSLRGKFKRSPILKQVKPKDMSYVPRVGGDELSLEEDDAITGMVLSIFTDCVNVGRTFQCALTSIYFSGLQHGHSITKEKYEEKKNMEDRPSIKYIEAPENKVDETYIYHERDKAGVTDIVWGTLQGPNGAYVTVKVYVKGKLNSEYPVHNLLAIGYV